MTGDSVRAVSMVIVDVAALAFSSATFLVLYATYRRTIQFKIDEVLDRIRPKDGTENAALKQQAKRLADLAELKHKGYFAPLAYCALISIAGMLVLLAKGELVPCSMGEVIRHCPAAPVAAFVSAYLFTLFDLVRRHRRMEMHADAVQQGWLRMLAAPVLAALFVSMLKDAFAIPTAAALGVIPVGEVMSNLANRGRKALGMDSSSQNAQASDLGELQGMDKERLERFMSEGVTTIQQLAFGDTLATFVAVNIDWKTLLDYVDQSLLYCYLGPAAVAEYRKRGIRGSIEVVELSDNLASKTEAIRKSSGQLVKDLAEVQKIASVGVFNLIQTISADGQVEVLRKLWADSFQEPEDDGDDDSSSPLAHVDAAA